MSFTPFNELGSEAGLNDIWGWTDPETGKEYALVGKLDGTAFVDMTDALNPFLVGFLPTHTMASTWRDIKVYADHAFIVSEAPGHGMQVFDLGRLRDVNDPPEDFEADAHYDGFGNSHNIAINEATGFAYPIGTSLFSGGPHFIDIQDPLNPTLVGSFSEEGYSHDAQIVNYNGPDEDHQGSEIYFGFHGNNSEGLVIVDVTDKSDPEFLSRTGYDCQDYSHQGWISEDQRYCFLNDELDEGSFGYNTRTRIFDITDLDEPFLLGNFVSDIPSTDHNLYVHNGLAFMSNYTGGLRVLDITRLDEGIVEEVAYFDVHPQNNASGYSGTWSNYPYFESGNIPVTHRTDGLFIVRLQDLSNVIPQQPINTSLCDDATGLDESVSELFKLWPNPSSGNVNLFLGTDQYNHRLQIVDAHGKVVMDRTVSGITNNVLETDELALGVYTILLDGEFLTRLVTQY